MYNRLYRILACDRQTNGHTSCHGIVRAMHAMHTRRAVKIVYFGSCHFYVRLTDIIQCVLLMRTTPMNNGKKYKRRWLALSLLSFKF